MATVSLKLFGRPQNFSQNLVTEFVLPPKPPIWALRFSGFFMFVVLPDVLGGNERLFEAAINLAQFPEDQH